MSNQKRIGACIGTWMKLLDRKSKMVSFRVSNEEYRTMLDACTAHGVRSISELARIALTHLVSGPDDDPNNAPQVSDEVIDLRYRLQALSNEVERLAKRVTDNKFARSMSA